MYSNVLLALSNLVVFPTLYYLIIQYNKNKNTKNTCIKRDLLLATGIALASFFQHLSDIKHNQSGIWPFRFYAIWFLYLDRFMCVVTGIYLFPRILELSKEKKKFILFFLVIGLSMMGISEIWCGPNDLMEEFIYTHGIWHLCGYSVLHIILVDFRISFIDPKNFLHCVLSRRNPRFFTFSKNQ